jgi:hypothetical protein
MERRKGMRGEGELEDGKMLIRGWGVVFWWDGYDFGGTVARGSDGWDYDCGGFGSEYVYTDKESFGTQFRLLLFIHCWSIQAHSFPAESRRKACVWTAESLVAGIW